VARIAGSDGVLTAEAIRRAGLRLIHDHGFEGFGLRELAKQVGVQPASLYNYFGSKQDLLFGLINAHMDALIESAQQALDSCDRDVLSRLVAFCMHHMEYHIDRKLEVVVANFELRALNEENARIVRGRRHRYEMMLIDLLDEGRASGLVGAEDTHVAAYASTWYRPDGRLSRRKVAELHVKMVLDGCLQRTPASSRVKATLPRPANTGTGPMRTRKTLRRM
jgi:AcrR family transcriptional regulator